MLRSIPLTPVGCTVVLIALAHGTTLRAAAAAFDLTILARSGQDIGGKTIETIESFAMNKDRGLAFVATFAGGRGVFTRDQLLVRNRDEISERTLISMSDPMINDDGMIAFSAQFVGSGFPLGTGIFTPDEFQVGPGSEISGETIGSVSFPVLNNTGDFAFRSFFSGGTGVFKTGQKIADSDDEIAGELLTNFGQVDLNDRGDVAYRATLCCDEGSGVFLGRSLIAKGGSQIDGTTLSSVPGERPLVNQEGTLAFLAVDEANANVIATQGRILTRNGSQIDGENVGIVNRPESINRDGTVAFVGAINGQTPAVFTQHEHVFSRGDTVDGLRSLSISNPVVSDRGEIAFLTTFVGGGNGIVLAVPDSPADFNDDGRVDGDDFLIWQRGFGTSGASAAEGDADLDGDVDGDDFLHWQTEFGRARDGDGDGGQADGMAVPAPSAVWLGLVLLVAIASRRSRS